VILSGYIIIPVMVLVNGFAPLAWGGSCTGENAARFDDAPFSLSYESWHHNPQKVGDWAEFERCVISLNNQRPRIDWENTQVKGLVSDVIPQKVLLKFPNESAIAQAGLLWYGIGNPLDRNKNVYHWANEEELLLKQGANTYQMVIPDQMESLAETLLPGENPAHDIDLSVKLTTFNQGRAGFKYVIEFLQNGPTREQNIKPQEFTFSIDGEVLGPISRADGWVPVTERDSKIEMSTTAWSGASRAVLGVMRIFRRGNMIAAFPVSYLVPWRMARPEEQNSPGDLIANEKYPELREYHPPREELALRDLRLVGDGTRRGCTAGPVPGARQIEPASLSVVYSSGAIKPVPPGLVTITTSSDDRVCVSIKGTIPSSAVGTPVKIRLGLSE
jgi:hypothetical protein